MIAVVPFDAVTLVLVILIAIIGLAVMVTIKRRRWRCIRCGQSGANIVTDMIPGRFCQSCIDHVLEQLRRRHARCKECGARAISWTDEGDFCGRHIPISPAFARAMNNLPPRPKAPPAPPPAIHEPLAPTPDETPKKPTWYDESEDLTAAIVGAAIVGEMIGTESKEGETTAIASDPAPVLETGGGDSGGGGASESWTASLDTDTTPDNSSDSTSSSDSSSSDSSSSDS
jgi:uncharacterized membrane protein YgcG